MITPGVLGLAGRTQPEFKAGGAGPQRRQTLMGPGCAGPPGPPSRVPGCEGSAEPLPTAWNAIAAPVLQHLLLSTPFTPRREVVTPITAVTAGLQPAVEPDILPGSPWRCGLSRGPVTGGRMPPCPATRMVVAACCKGCRHTPPHPGIAEGARRQDASDRPVRCSAHLRCGPCSATTFLSEPLLLVYDKT